MKNFTELAIELGVDVVRVITNKSDEIKIIKPKSDGIIVDSIFDPLLVRHIIKSCMSEQAFLELRVIVPVPFGLSQNERKKLKQVFLQNGAKKCFLIENPMLLATGSGVDLNTANLIINIGLNTTEVSLVSLGGLVEHESILIGTKSIDASSL